MLYMLRKLFIVIFLLVLFITSVTYYLFGVWIPDVFGSFKILSSNKDKNGRYFYVVQYWNNVDFYTLEIIMISKNGKKYICYIDSDSNKRWKSDLIINVDEKSILVDGVHYDLDLFSTCDDEKYSLGCRYMFKK